MKQLEKVIIQLLKKKGRELDGKCPKEIRDTLLERFPIQNGGRQIFKGLEER